MVWEFVPTSGAGMSRLTPRTCSTLTVYLRVNVPDLVGAEGLGVALHTALGAAEGYVDESRLPCHQGGQGAHLFEVGPWMEAHASLVRAAGPVVLHAIAGEDLDAPVIHPDGNRYGELAPGPAEELAYALAEVQPLDGPVDEEVDLFER